MKMVRSIALVTILSALFLISVDVAIAQIEIPLPSDVVIIADTFSQFLIPPGTHREFLTVSDTFSPFLMPPPGTHREFLTVSDIFSPTPIPPPIPAPGIIKEKVNVFDQFFTQSIPHPGTFTETFFVSDNIEFIFRSDLTLEKT